MELTLSFRAKEGLLCATYVGAFSLAEAERTFPQILAAVDRHKARKVVVDCSKVTGAPTVMERFLYASFAAKLSCTRGLTPRFAYILVPPMLDPRRLGETVAVNRGMSVKAFDNLNDGLKWLGVDSRGELNRTSPPTH